MSLRITILTVCPEMTAGLTEWPVIRRAIAKGVLQLDVVDLREYAPGSFRHVDDAPFGGGPGMILRCQPVLDALRDRKGQDGHTVLLSPAGRRYCQADAHRFAGEQHLLLLCGHYEGIDARILPFVDEEVSVGDFILTGGEPAAMMIADSVARLLPGALRQSSTEEESFENGLLEYPQYTQPAVYEGMEVPAVLRSGDHGKIRRFRLTESLRLTLARRPDLLEARRESGRLTREEQEILDELMKNEESDGHRKGDRMELKDLVRRNRSFRGYDHSVKLTRDQLTELVELARLCPSSVNMQPLRYRLVYGEDEVSRLQKETRWAKGLPELHLPHPGKEPSAFIVICQDDRIDGNLSRFQRDVGIVAQTMLLGAVEMGFGGIMIGNFTAGSVRETLGLDEHIHPLLIVALGMPDEEIILTEVGEDGSTAYYRDAQDRHYVPKRKIEDLLL